ncbi:hypothetical protein Tco_0646741 [Tanacetum coccineum]
MTMTALGDDILTDFKRAARDPSPYRIGNPSLLDAVSRRVCMAQRHVLMIRPNVTRPTAPPGFQSGQQTTQQAFSPQQQALLSGTVQGSTPANGQATLLPQAFNTMTLRDPTDANWNMDTGASSHLNSNATNLSTLFNSCMYPSVLVGDGKSIPVTNTGHSTLPTPYRPLHLNNVLITPNIVKNLISVRQFVRDNKCTIEFDEFGFSVKDYWTRQILLRCDSTGDLYPVTNPTTPQAFLVSQHTWHQLLGHPGSDVLRSICFWSYFEACCGMLTLLWGVVTPVDTRILKGFLADGDPVVFSTCMRSRRASFLCLSMRHLAPGNIVDACHILKKARLILEGIAASMLWSIWKFRNDLISSVSKPKKALIWDSIVNQSFLWISS